MFSRVSVASGYVEDGHAALARGDPVATKVGFEAAIAFDAGAADAYLGLGLALQTLERLSESRAAYERAFALYRTRGDPVGAFRAARVIATFCGGMDGNWVLYHGWDPAHPRILQPVHGRIAL